MKLSARNVLRGTVLDVKEGPANSPIHVDIGGGNTITTDAARDLGVAEGKDVYIVIKASQVMLATD